MVRLTVRVSEVEQFSLEVPAATTTAGQATRALARLHNLRVSIARLRAEGAAMVAAAERRRTGQEADQGDDVSNTNSDNTTDHLLKALADAEAAAFQQKEPLAAAALRSHVARVRAAADAAIAALTSGPASDAATADAANANNTPFLRALEAAEADAKAAEDGDDEEQNDAKDQGADGNTPNPNHPNHPAPPLLNPRLAAAWFCGRALQPAEATLAQLLGGGCALKADRTRAVLRLSRDLASGCPARVGAMMDGGVGVGVGGNGGGNGGGGGSGGGATNPSADERRAMLAWCHKRQQELARLDEAARDGADDHCDAPWADPTALRRDLTGVGAVRWRC